MATPPDAAFDLTAPSSSRGVAGWAAVVVAITATTVGHVLGLALVTAVAAVATSVLVAVAWRASRTTTVARVDEVGLHLRADGRARTVPWLTVRRVEALGLSEPVATVLRVIHDDGRRTTVPIAESAAATGDALRAAKVAGIVPGWVRVGSLETGHGPFGSRRPRLRQRIR